MIVSNQTTNVNSPSIMSDSTALASNPARVGWTIQNLGQNELYVLMGSGASTSVFHNVLKKGTANDDGTGGSTGQEQGVIYTGIITIAGSSPRYVCTEFAP
jgi:hypothetical protein